MGLLTGSSLCFISRLYLAPLWFSLSIAFSVSRQALIFFHFGEHNSKVFPSRHKYVLAVY